MIQLMWVTFYCITILWYETQKKKMRRTKTTRTPWYYANGASDGVEIIYFEIHRIYLNVLRSAWKSLTRIHPFNVSNQITLKYAEFRLSFFVIYRKFSLYDRIFAYPLFNIGRESIFLMVLFIINTIQMNFQMKFQM